MTDTEVIRLIEDVWREARYPGDDRIVPAGSLEFHGIENYFRGTTWRGHSAIDLRCHRAAFSFFTPQAFRYWLPAFMIAAIKDPEGADVVGDYIPRAVIDSFARERLRLFSPLQREADLVSLCPPVLALLPQGARPPGFVGPNRASHVA